MRIIYTTRTGFLDRSSATENPSRFIETKRDGNDFLVPRLQAMGQDQDPSVVTVAGCVELDAKLSKDIQEMSKSRIFKSSTEAEHPKMSPAFARTQNIL